MNSCGEQLIARFGEETIREISTAFPNGVLPGAKFWIQRRRKHFLRQYREGHISTVDVRWLARKYEVSTRTIYAWLRQVQKEMERRAKK